MSQAHLQHIFGLYAKTPVRTERHFRDYSRALVFFESKEDAKSAYEHLGGNQGRPKLEIKRREDSKVDNDENCARIDG